MLHALFCFLCGIPLSSFSLHSFLFSCKRPLFLVLSPGPLRLLSWVVWLFFSLFVSGLCVGVRYRSLCLRVLVLHDVDILRRAACPAPRSGGREEAPTSGCGVDVASQRREESFKHNYQHKRKHHATRPTLPGKWCWCSHTESAHRHNYGHRGCRHTALHSSVPTEASFRSPLNAVEGHQKMPSSSGVPASRSGA
jgi:hypothetical protein